MAGIGGEGEVGDALTVAGEGLEGSESGCGVGYGGFVCGAGGEEFSVGGEFDGGDCAFVGGESVFEFVGFYWFRLR